MTRRCKRERRIIARLHRGERLADYLPEGEEPAGTSVEDVCVKNDLRHPRPFPTVGLCLGDVAAPNVAKGEQALVERGRNDCRFSGERDTICHVNYLALHWSNLKRDWGFVPSLWALEYA